MDSMTKLAKNMEIIMSGTILLKFLITFLLLPSLRDPSFVSMVDYHPESPQSITCDPFKGMFKSQTLVLYVTLCGPILKRLTHGNKTHEAQVGYLERSQLTNFCTKTR